MLARSLTQRLNWISMTAVIVVFVGNAVAQNTFPSSGNVGIGLTSPQSQLHVFSAASTETREVLVLLTLQ